MTSRFGLHIVLLVGLLLTGVGVVFGNVTSSTGTIAFDVNDDSQSEMSLSANGLGVGVASTAKLHVNGNTIISHRMRVGSTSSGSGNLSLSGTMGLSIASTSSDIEIGSHSMVFGDSQTRDLTLALPRFSEAIGRIFYIKKFHRNNTLNIIGGGSIDSFASGFTLSAGNLGAVKLLATSDKWVILSTTESSLTAIDILWTPERTSSVLWLDGSDEGTITGSSPVTLWEDKSGNGRDVTISSGDPSLSSAVWNGLDAIDFDGNDIMRTSGVSLSLGSVQLAMVFRLNSAGPAYQGGFSIEGDELEFRESNNSERLQVKADTGSGDNYKGGPTGVFSYGGPFIGSYSYNGSTHSVHSNGTSSSETAFTGTYDITRMVIGSVPSNTLNGMIGEVIVAESSDNSIRQRLEGYLAHKWGLESDLNSDHPYKSSAPLIYPIIVSVTADDPDDAVSGIDAGDTITLVFDGATNTPDADTKSDIDEFISFGSNVLGGDYSGNWNGTLDTLTITLSDNTGASAYIGQSVSILSGGNLTFAGCVMRSSFIANLGGDFGPGTWSPENITTLAWYDASDALTVVSSGGNVSQWNDKSGTGANLMSSGSGHEPIIGSTNLNGLNTLDFDGSDNLINSSFPVPTSGDIAIFMIAKVDTISNEYQAIFSLDATNDMQFDADDTSSFYGRFQTTGIGSTQSSTGGPFDGPSIYNCNFDRTGSAIYNAYVDGTQRIVDTGYTTKLDTPQVFGVMINRGKNLMIQGEVAEIIVVEDMSSDTRKKIEGYLAHKWGLESSLPGGHPYLSVSP